MACVENNHSVYSKMNNKMISLDVNNKKELDFISPIKMLIKKKTLDDIKMYKTAEEIKSLTQNDDTDSIYKNGILKSKTKKKINLLNKKVVFRSEAKHNNPLAEVICVKSYKKDTFNNTFKGIKNRELTDTEDKSQRIVCGCVII
jgi:hypothetical protein